MIFPSIYLFHLHASNNMSNKLFRRL